MTKKELEVENKRLREQINKMGNDRTCPQCGGSGRVCIGIPGDKFDCGVCGGYGQI